MDVASIVGNVAVDVGYSKRKANVEFRIVPDVKPCGAIDAMR
jgi:hypothetical protein